MDTASTDAIAIAEAPTVPGLRFRAFRGAADYAPMVAVHAGCLAADQLDPYSARDPLPTVEDFAHGFAATPAGAPKLLMAEGDGALVGYTRTTCWTEEDGTWVYLHLQYLLPAWRGRGIEEALLRWAEDSLRALAAGQATQGKAVLATNVASGETAKAALMLRAGYAPVRWLSDMRADGLDAAHLPSTALPDGVEARPLSPEQYPAIHAMFRDAWTGTWGNSQENESTYAEFLEDMVDVLDFDPALWRVAWHGDEAVGAVVGRIHSGQGYVDYVATRRAWQRRGIAGALLAACLRGFVARGLTSARLFTHAGNERGAKAIYERAGFRTLTEHGLYRKPLP